MILMVCVMMRMMIGIIFVRCDYFDDYDEIACIMAFDVLTKSMMHDEFYESAAWEFNENDDEKWCLTLDENDVWHLMINVMMMRMTLENWKWEWHENDTHLCDYVDKVCVDYRAWCLIKIMRMMLDTYIIEKMMIKK